MLLLVSAGPLSGVAQAANVVGQVTHLSGTPISKRADGSANIFSLKSEVQERDMLTTEQEIYARIKFSDGAEVVLRPGSRAKVAALAVQR